MPERATEFQNTSFVSLYEERFGEVAHFCGKVVRWRSLLRSTWDANKFRRGPLVASRGKQADAQFDPDEMTAIVTDNWLWAYLQMITEAHGLLQGLADWAEGCECHKDIAAVVESPDSRHTIFRNLFIVLFAVCFLEI